MDRLLPGAPCALAFAKSRDLSGRHDALVTRLPESEAMTAVARIGRNAAASACIAMALTGCEQHRDVAAQSGAASASPGGPPTGASGVSVAGDAATGPVSQSISNADGVSVIDPTRLYMQETAQWCWAASAESMMDTVSGTDVKQCVQANKELSHGAGDCCNSKNRPDACVQPAWPSFSDFGFSADETAFDQSLSYADLASQIQRKIPVGFVWNYISPQGSVAGAHMQVAIGYRTQDSVGNVLSFDPLSGDRSWMSYSEYVGSGSNGSHAHSKDYYNLRVMPGGDRRPPPEAASTGLARKSSKKMLSQTVEQLPHSAEDAAAHFPLHASKEIRMSVQSDQLVRRLGEARSALAKGVATLVPIEYQHPAPGGAPDSAAPQVGSAVAGVNLYDGDLFDLEGGAHAKAPAKVLNDLALRLRESPTEIFVPAGRDATGTGVLALTSRNGEWTHVAWQLPENALSMALAQVRAPARPGVGNASAPGAIAPQATASVVHVAGVVTFLPSNAHFVALERGTEIELQPLSGAFGLVNGKPLPGTQVIDAVQQGSRAYLANRGEKHPPPR